MFEWNKVCVLSSIPNLLLFVGKGWAIVGLGWHTKEEREMAREGLNGIIGVHKVYAFVLAVDSPSDKSIEWIFMRAADWMDGGAALKVASKGWQIRTSCWSCRFNDGMEWYPGLWFKLLHTGYYSTYLILVACWSVQFSCIVTDVNPSSHSAGRILFSLIFRLVVGLFIEGLL